MDTFTQPDVAHNLALAIVTSSHAPAILLSGDLKVVAASSSFYRTFELEPRDVAGRKLFAVGGGLWDVAKLRSLLDHTLAGKLVTKSYEMDLKVKPEPRRLVINAQRLEYGDVEEVRLLLTISDITEARLNEKLKDDMLREKAILLQELQHRVANSLQIIASVLLQSAKRVRSDETRVHLRDAHNRVMSIATVQQQLAASRLGDVELRDYFTELCQSLGKSMIHDHSRLSLIVNADECSVKGNISVSLGLIVTELVINALKHAFPGDHGGSIVVDFKWHEGDWKLSVSDNGVGTRKSLAHAKPGLGTSIVGALANQLHATVETECVDPGIRVSIVHSSAKHPDEDIEAAR